MDEREIREIIAKNVTTLMREKDISPSMLIKKSNISQGAISRIINAKMNMTLNIALNLAQGLSVQLSELLQGIEAQVDALNKKEHKHADNFLSIGILSINKKRITCITKADQVIGTSELTGGLDLAKTAPFLLNAIYESILACGCNEEINKKILKDSQLNLVTQSYEFDETKNKFIHFLKKYFADALIFSDWQMTYLANFSQQPGICLIADKGVSLSYCKNGYIKKLGGWKFPVYDLGGENWLGIETIKHTIEAVEGYIPMTNLARDLILKFDNKIEKITEICFKEGFKRADPDIYCMFAEFLIKSYMAGDNTAKEIIKSGFEQISKLICKVDEINKKKLKIALSGSLTTIYQPFLPNHRLFKPVSLMETAKLLAKIDQGYLEKYHLS